MSLLVLRLFHGSSAMPSFAMLSATPTQTTVPWRFFELSQLSSQLYDGRRVLSVPFCAGEARFAGVPGVSVLILLWSGRFGSGFVSLFLDHLPTRCVCRLV